MVGRDDDSFYLYGVGEKPEALTLGSLVLEKYWQPLIARHYTHEPLRGQDLEENVWSSNLKNCVFHGRTRFSPGVGVSGFDIIDLKLAWNKDQERIITAKSGKRMTLKEPETFLCNEVLANPKAKSALKLWLSSARSDYVMNMKWARRPKIWLLTGLYVLEGTRTVVRKKTSADVDVGLSSAIVGALSGVPVGGSVSLGLGDSWDIQMEMEEEHVWAAQYRLLDARYIALKSGEQLALPSTMSLYKDVLSVRTRRSNTGMINKDTRLNVKLGLKPLPESRPVLDAVPYSLEDRTVEVVTLEPAEEETEIEVIDPWDGAEDLEEESEEAFEEYEKSLEQAIRMFEAAPQAFLER